MSCIISTNLQEVQIAISVFSVWLVKKAEKGSHKSRSPKFMKDDILSLAYFFCNNFPFDSLLKTRDIEKFTSKKQLNNLYYTKTYPNRQLARSGP